LEVGTEGSVGELAADVVDEMVKKVERAMWGRLAKNHKTGL
jgi:hypothetical protein